MSSQGKNLAAVVPAIGKDLVLVERDIPSKIGADDVLIHNHVVAINPVDGKRQLTGLFTPSFPAIIGSDVAGTVLKVGANVPPSIAQPGDRVLALLDGFATNDDDRCGFQTYSVAPSLIVSKLPEGVSFLQGSTLPTAAVTAAMVLFDGLGWPLPKTAAATSSDGPIFLVWGGSSSVGNVAIQLARIAGYTVYTTASPQHHAYLKELGASVVVDYHAPAEAVKQLVDTAQKAGKPIEYALDTQGYEDTFRGTVEVLEKTASSKLPTLAHINPMAQKFFGSEKVTHKIVNGGLMLSKRRDLGTWLYSDNLYRWLQTKTIVPGPYRVIEGGLGGLQTGINLVNKGVSGEKVVVEVS